MYYNIIRMHGPMNGKLFFTYFPTYKMLWIGRVGVFLPLLAIVYCHTTIVYRHTTIVYCHTTIWLRWSRGSVLASGTQVRGFKPGRSHRNFKGEKILSTPSFGGEVKPSVPCRRFAACKRSLELRGSRILGQNMSEHFSPTKSSTFRY